LTKKRSEEKAERKGSYKKRREYRKDRREVIKGKRGGEIEEEKGD